VPSSKRSDEDKGLTLPEGVGSADRAYDRRILVYSEDRRRSGPL
jgi:hypothetical protein